MTRVADHNKLMALVESMSPETRARIAGRMDDRFHEVTGTPREGCDCEPELTACKHACGYFGTGTDLSTHERAEHSRCHQCGSDPVGTAPVAHMSDCTPVHPDRRADVNTAELNFGPAARRLIVALDRYDEGEGVTFQQLSRNRWRLLMNGDIFLGSTFHPLERHGLLDTGYSNSAPVTITEKGRAYVAAKGWAS